MKARGVQRKKIRKTKANHGQKPTLHRRKPKLRTGPKR
jgi:hypothetical protein